VAENLTAGPLDRDYAATWSSMPAVEQWWLAMTGGVGPAPTLAPGALLEISLALALATIRHPAFSTQKPASFANRLSIGTSAARGWPFPAQYQEGRGPVRRDRRGARPRSQLPPGVTPMT